MLFQIGGNTEEDEIEEMSFIQTVVRDVNLSFFQEKLHLISPWWILLDSESTISIFNNAEMVSNIRHCGNKKGLTLLTNGGKQVSTLIADYPGFGTVWFNPLSLANILSLAAVRKLFRVTMDSTVEASLAVHRSDGSIMKFMESNTGLYYYDCESKHNHSNHTLSPYSFLNTVEKNKELFTRREIKGAESAITLRRRIGRPVQRRFESILENNLINNLR